MIISPYQSITQDVRNRIFQEFTSGSRRLLTGLKNTLLDDQYRNLVFKQQNKLLVEGWSKKNLGL
jgi:hypothetical protein